MVVASLLPPSLLGELTRALADSPEGEYEVRRAPGLAELARWVREDPVDVVLVDPNLVGPDGVDAVLTMVAEYPSVPVVVYTTLTPTVARAISEMARRGVYQVLLHRFDDEPGRLRGLIEHLPGVQLSDDVLARIAGPLRRLPVTVQRAVERLFHHPDKMDTEALARAAGVPVRTLYRLLEVAGLASPATLVRGARLLRAYALLGNAKATAETVASKLEYGSRQLFARHVRHAFGTTVAELRGRVGPEELVARLARLVTAGGTDDDERVTLDEEPGMDAREG